MLPHKELSTDLRDAIIRQFQNGNCYSKIASVFGVLYSIVQGIVACWKTLGMNINMPQKGWPNKLQGRGAGKVGVIMKVNPVATREDLATVGVSMSKSTIT